jgi:hypothetical protein
MDIMLSSKLREKSAYYKLTVEYSRAALVRFIPLLIACGIFLSVIAVKSPTLLFCLLLGILSSVTIQQVGKQMGLSASTLMSLQVTVIAGILSLFWLDYFAHPAAAQFFGKAENFFKNTLTQGSQGDNASAAVGLVFNVLRALYLLYVAVALIGVINAVRQDEDWQVVARTPLLVVIAVTIADVLTSFIIGS